MDKRIRSPNYPALSLREAMDKITVLYKNLHTHAAPREVIAKSMGYNSLNGASATAISALHKYGLLDRSGEDIKISDRAMRILHPHSPQERSQAIRDAANEPQLFAELAERFPGALPNEELLRNYLLRSGFAPGAVSGVILAYRETVDLVDRESGGYHGGQQTLEAPIMQPLPSPPITGHLGGIITQTQEDERPLARYDFEGGGYIRILLGGAVETEQALNMAETLINLKRQEIKSRNARALVIREAEDEDKV